MAREVCCIPGLFLTPSQLHYFTLLSIFPGVNSLVLAPVPVLHPWDGNTPFCTPFWLISPELNHLVYPLITSKLQATVTTLRGLGVAGTLLSGSTVSLFAQVWWGIPRKSHLSIFVFLYLHFGRKSTLLFVAKLSDRFDANNDEADMLL